MKAFLTASTSTGVLALSFTPEFTNTLSILIAALFVGAVNLYMARTARLVAMKEMAKALAPVVEKVDALAPVVAKIEGHVNSEKTKAEGESVQLKLQIDLQREMIEELKRAAALLAQARASTDLSTIIAGAVTPSATPAALSSAAPVILANIETNTAETAVNTKKTDDAVTELKKKKP